VGTFFQADPGETIWDALRRPTPWFEPDGENPFHKTVLQPGQFYPRMARPDLARPEGTIGSNPGAADEADLIAVARGQLTTLTRQLDRICQTVHPADETLSVYGHDIRNLLILACTEVESHWRGVLIANGIKKSNNRFNTTDYVVLCEAMKLDEYAVGFPNYPWLEESSPFAGWESTGNPTQDIEWYDAYNAVKHSRETDFSRATLRYAFEAINACAIMMAAQFGLCALGRELLSFFHFSEIPTWPLSEIYLHPYASESWCPVPYPFGAAQG
jgi:hypothetical protein